MAYEVVANSFDEAYRLATIISKTEFAGKNYRGKPDDVFVAIQYGAELGLKPLQALQNIAVINGKPSVYGDGALALVFSHPDFAGIHQEIKEIKGFETAVCTIKRIIKNEVHTYTYAFSVEDAKKAGLLTKAGIWQQYPKRMLQWRATGFCLRDSFADVLKGMPLREEAEDYEPLDVTPKKEKKEFIPLMISKEENQISEENNIAEVSFDKIELCMTKQEVVGQFNLLKEEVGDNKETIEQLKKAARKRTIEIEQLEKQSSQEPPKTQLEIDMAEFTTAFSKCTTKEMLDVEEKHYKKKHAGNQPMLEEIGIARHEAEEKLGANK